MKTIFIATDFSVAAQNAGIYAVEWANMLKAKVVLFNGYTVPLSVPESYVLVKPEEVRQTALTYLQEEADLLKPKLFNGIQVVAEEGSSAELIIRTAMEYPDPLIVMGMKQAGKVWKNWFGDTVSGLARKSRIPVLIVPEEAKFVSLDKMVLGIENDFETNLQPLQVIREIGMAFRSQVYLVRVLSFQAPVASELTARSSHLMHTLEPLEAKYHFPRAEDTTTGLNDFVQETDADLLCVLPKQHSLLERIFTRSETRKLIFHSHIPLLLLPDTTAEKKESPARSAYEQISS